LGTYSFLLGLNQCIISEGITNYTLIPQKKGEENVRYLCWVGNSAERILDWIYKDTTLYLPRKKAVYNIIKHSDSSVLLDNINNGKANYNTQMSEKFSDKDIVEAIVNTIS
jgi:Zn/Cd-binding protein ZinT